MLAPMLGILLGAFLAILGSVFAAMMTVSEPAALANLKTYWLAWGFSIRAGIFLGIAIAVAGIILIISRITYRVTYGGKAQSSAPGQALGRVSAMPPGARDAMVEVKGGLRNSLIQGCETPRDTILRVGGDADGVEVRGCVAGKIDDKKK